MAHSGSSFILESPEALRLAQGAECWLFNLIDQAGCERAAGRIMLFVRGQMIQGELQLLVNNELITAE